MPVAVDRYCASTGDDAMALTPKRTRRQGKRNPWTGHIDDVIAVIDKVVLVSLDD
jgi:hypothetical protein